MSKRVSISRYNLIIKKLRKKTASFNEISDFLALESELQGYDFNISKRTFKRDIDDICALYNIEIKYDFSRKVYYINQENQPDINERILEAFDTFNALNISDRLSNHIHFEKRKPQGTEYLYGLLHSIKNTFQISFVYQKYWEQGFSERIVEPYALKEFKHRWYILAKDKKDGHVKSFALDRITELNISNINFDLPKYFDVNNYYQYCFGIISPNAKQPSEIEISCNPIQGKYIKSLPLHESQEILVDNDKELRVKIMVFITHDLKMELLSHGSGLKVIKPITLVQELKASLKNTLKLYD